MKKSITLVTLLAGAVGVHAQGVWGLSAYNGVSSSVLVYSPQLLTPTTETMGASALDINPGLTVYTGAGIGGGNTGSGPTAYGNGALWTAAVYAAPGADNLSGLAAAEAAGPANAIITSLFLTSGGTGILNTGTAGNDSAGMYAFADGKGTLTPFPSTTPVGPFGGAATIQIQVWYNGGTNNITYAQDQKGAGPFGASAVGEIAVLGDLGSPPSNPGTLNSAGISSFSLTNSIPEPSTIALGVIGASAMLFRRRK